MKKLIASLNRFYVLIKPIMPLLILGSVLSLLIFIFLLSLNGKIQLGRAKDIDNLRSKINEVESAFAQCSSYMESVKNIGDAASAQAASAEATANRAAQYALETNSKMDAVFKRFTENEESCSSSKRR